MMVGAAGDEVVVALSVVPKLMGQVTLWCDGKASSPSTA